VLRAGRVFQYPGRQCKEGLDQLTLPYSLLCVPCSLAPYSLSSVPYSQFPVPCSLPPRTTPANQIRDLPTTHPGTSQRQFPSGRPYVRNRGAHECSQAVWRPCEFAGPFYIDLTFALYSLMFVGDRSGSVTLMPGAARALMLATLDLAAGLPPSEFSCCLLAKPLLFDGR
jgi:hypothetical protein